MMIIAYHNELITPRHPIPKSSFDQCIYSKFKTSIHGVPHTHIHCYIHNTCSVRPGRCSTLTIIIVIIIIILLLLIIIVVIILIIVTIIIIIIITIIIIIITIIIIIKISYHASNSIHLNLHIKSPPTWHFKKYATLPQIRRGATSGLQRTCLLKRLPQCIPTW